MSEWNELNPESFRDDVRAGQNTSPLPELNAWLQDERLLPGGTPDLTRSVMGRLGYMKASSRVARRARRRRGLSRVLAAGVACAIAGAGLSLHHRGADVRRPSELTIPRAIGQDMDHSQHQLIRAFRYIRKHAPLPAPIEQDRQLPPAVPVEENAPPPVSPEDGTLAIGPMRWI